MLHWVKEEIRALVVCALLLLVGVVFVFVAEYTKEDMPALELTERDWEIMRELEQQMRADSISHAKQWNKNAVLAEKLFPFDPNHADSLTLLDLGLSSWQVSNMMKYRRMGGVWRSPDALSRLYGLTAADFKRLRPFIRIAPQDRSKREFYEQRQQVYKHRAESLHYDLIEKLDEGKTLELSLADTTDLKKIPGIGSYYAGKIVRYRERLGGFISLSQLDEIEGLPPGVSRWFTLDKKVVVRKISLNRATFKQIVRHPYLSYEQTKVIVNHIRKYGPLQSWTDLRLYKEFSDQDFERLDPYFTFD